MNGFLLACLVLLASAPEGVSAQMKYFSKHEVQQATGGCKYQGYEAYMNKTVVVAPLPNIAVAVPLSVLARSVGINKDHQLLTTGQKIAMQSDKIAKVVGSLVSKIPVIGPMLSMIASGFEGAFGHLKSVTTEMIIANVDKAVKQIVDGVNKRFKEMKNYVNQQNRALLRRLLTTEYQGKFDGWANCASKGTKQAADNCVIQIAGAMFTARRKFMYLYRNGETLTQKEDIRYLEMEIPMVVEWVTLHGNVLMSLINRYKGSTDANEKMHYVAYRDEFVRVMDEYIRYMKWAAEQIARARVELAPRTFTCSKYGEKTETKEGYSTFIKGIARRCTYSCLKMSPLLKCPYMIVYLCTAFKGNWIKSDTRLTRCSVRYRSDLKWKMENYRNKKATTTCNSIQSALRKDVNNWLDMTVRNYIPIFEAARDKILGSPKGTTTTMIYKEGTDIGSGIYSKTIMVTPGRNYRLKIAVLRNDLGDSSEKVSAIKVDGKNVGQCNPDGGDFACTFFNCNSQLGAIYITPTSSRISVSLTFVGHSHDCDCDKKTWECSKEYTVSGRSPMVAVARITLTPTGASPEKKDETDDIDVEEDLFKSDVTNVEQGDGDSAFAKIEEEEDSEENSIMDFEEDVKKIDISDVDTDAEKDDVTNFSAIVDAVSDIDAEDDDVDDDISAAISEMF